MKKLWLVSKHSGTNSILYNNVDIEAAVCTLAVFLQKQHPRENPPTEKDNRACSCTSSLGVSAGRGGS